MKVSPKYKRFKRINFVGDTFTLPSKRSSIIRTMQGYHRYPNTDDLKRLEKEPQNRGNETQKTDRIPFNVERALFTLPYADTVIITGHVARTDTKLSDRVTRPDGYVLHGQVFKKSKLYPINEMIPHLVYYSYATKYYNLTSMNIPGYQCSNIYIDVKKRALMNKYIQ